MDDWKRSVVRRIVDIQSGLMSDRDEFPESMKGEIAKDIWLESKFDLGMEYGYILALMQIFDISEDDYHRLAKNISPGGLE